MFLIYDMIHFLVGRMTKLEGEHYPSINRQGQREESTQGRLFQLFHKNFFYLPQSFLSDSSCNELPYQGGIMTLKITVQTSISHGVS